MVTVRKSETRGPGIFERGSYSTRAATTARRLRQQATAGERKLWEALRKLKLNIRRQAPVGNYVADFLCHAAKLVLEIDGYHHTTDEVQLRDLERDGWFASQGYTVMRFTDREAYEQTERVSCELRDVILKALPPRGGKGWDGGVALGQSRKFSMGAEPILDTSATGLPTPPSPTLPPSRGKGEEHAASIWDVLRQVPDPEIPAVSVVDLGIVRGVTEQAVTITPTYTGCPATVVIEGSIRAALDAAGFGHVQIRTVLDPPWTTDGISDEGREKLRAYGIAPPPKGAGAKSLAGEQPVECPQCRSTHTEEISRFGSTPCKALWRCLDCAEPFDRFKCH